MSLRSKHAKKYAVSTRRASSGKVFVATFRDAANRRRNKSLRTESPVEAQIIADSLTQLYNGDALTPDIHRTAIKLFYGDDATLLEAPPEDPSTLPSADTPHEVRLLQIEVKELRKQNQALTLALAETREKLKAHKKTVEGRIVEAEQRAPSIADCFERFCKTKRGKKQKGNKNTEQTLKEIDAFIDQLPPDIAKPTDIGADHIEHYITDRVNKSEATRPAKFRRVVRTRLGRFIEWTAKLYDFRSPMKNVEVPEKEKIKAETAPIHWHEREEIESTVEPLDTYWTAVVSLYAYAGLRRSELCRLHRDEIAQDKDNRKWYIQIRSNPDDPTKTGEPRKIEIDNALLPRLQAHLAADYNIGGNRFAFGPHPEQRIRPTKAEVAAWELEVEKAKAEAKKTGKRYKKPKLQADLTEIHLRASQITHIFKGDDGTGSRKAKAGLLPEGMTCQTLRHTFGSLLLRDGYSYEQIAAVMGNSPDVARKYYANIKGKDVELNK